MRRFFMVLALALVLAGIPSLATADEPLVCTAENPCQLRVGSVAPPGTPWAQIVTQLKRRIQRKSDGRIRVRAFLGQALGGEKSIVRRCRRGTLEMIGVSTGAIATMVPELNAYELPFLFESFEQADKALDATFATADSFMQARGFQLYFWSENGFRSFATKESFVRAPSDLRGMKMRAQESFVHTEMYRAMGAEPNPIAVAQVAEDLANGVVQGYDNGLLYSYAAQWYKHIRYVTLTRHIYQPAVIAYNKAWLDRMPADLRELLMADQERQTRLGRRRIRAVNREFQALMERDGVQFHTPSSSERSSLANATRRVYDTFRSRAGADGARLLDEILANR